jgi:peptidyl-prolyl cis-trans isomerase B (cyclophilin B)
MRRTKIVVFLVAVALMASACGDDDKNNTTATPGTTATGDASGGTTRATIETTLGKIVIELDMANAPKAAGRFADLAREGFYDGLTFHRVIPDFVIQGGDPKGDGTGGSDTEPVVGETPSDGYSVGSLAAAKTGMDPPGTFDCQFFIVTGASGAQLPPEYARFGQVVEGLDVAQKIQSVKTGANDAPVEKVVMKKVTISE